MVSPASSAIGRSRWTASSTSSRKNPAMKPPISSLAARVPSGGSSPGRYLPVSTPWASGDQTTCEMPCWRQTSSTPLRSIAPPQQRVLGLAGDGLLPPVLVGQRDGRVDLLRRPLREPPAARLAGADGLREGGHGLVQRGALVVAMALVEVDVARAQPRQRRVELLVDLRGRQPAVGLGHREVDLRGQHEAVAVEPGEDLAPGLLGGPAAVDVGGVEERDARVERGAGARLGLLAPHPARVGQPGAEGHLGDLQVAVAQLPVAHDGGLPTGPAAHRRAAARAVRPHRARGMTAADGRRT